MRKRRAPNMSVLSKYLLSYGGLVLFTCSLIVTVICYMSVLRLDAQMRQHKQYQLGLLAEDLGKRVATMHDIALDVAITAEYKPYFIKRGTYYEMDLLEALSKYEGRTRLDSDYFLLYHESNTLYTKDGKYTPDIFFSYYYSKADGAALAQACRSAEAFTILQGPPLAQGVQLWCLPIRLLAVQDASSRVTLGFNVQQSVFEGYVTDVIGEAVGDISIWYGDMPVAMLGDEPPLAWSEDLFRAEVGDFSLWLRPGRFNGYESTLLFIQNNVWLLALLLLCSLLVGIVLAYRNYRPIQQTFTQWGEKSPERDVKDELSGLQMAFARYDLQQREDARRLDEQLHMLRRQLVALMLSGAAYDLESPVAQALGVRMPGPYVCVLAVYADAGTDASEAKVLEAVRQTQLPGMYGYVGFSAEAGCIAVLLSLTDEAQRLEAVPLLYAACQAQGLSVLMGVGRCHSALSKLQASFLEATSALNNAEDGKIRLYEDITAHEDLLIGENEAMTTLLACLRVGDGAGAQARLDTLMDHIVRVTPSLLLQCYLCTRVLNEIVQTAGRLSLPMPHELVGWIYMSQSTKAYHEGISEVLWTLCEQSRAENPENTEAISEELLHYVNAHLLDYALSLDMLSEHFSLSASQISRAFRQHTGESFKDYIVRHRVAQARQLIAREDLTIAELCTRVGYTNVSHFIKIFKSQVGITPAAYKKKLLDDEAP